MEVSCGMMLTQAASLFSTRPLHGKEEREREERSSRRNDNRVNEHVFIGSYSYRANLLATASSGTVTYATECIPARLDMF